MERPFAVVRVACAPARAEPSQRSEMVTQWICGEVLEIIESRDEWLRSRGPDGYATWVHRGGVLRLDAEGAESWRESASSLSLGTRLTRREPTGDPDWAPDHGGGPPRALPWGARIAEEPAGGVRLPTGLRARPEDPERIVSEGELRERFPAEPDAILRTAARWDGVPYLWGGRTRAGVDCSGFVQSVFGLHGVPLPRDSGDQLAAGPRDGEDPGGRAGTGPDPRRPRPADLLFFGRDEESITHVAFSLGESRILHAAASNGQVATDDLSGEAPIAGILRGKLVGATRPLSPR